MRVNNAQAMVGALSLFVSCSSLGGATHSTCTHFKRRKKKRSIVCDDTYRTGYKKKSKCVSSARVSVNSVDICTLCVCRVVSHIRHMPAVCPCVVAPFTYSVISTRANMHKCWCRCVCVCWMANV